MEKNKKILDNFKNSKESREEAKKIEMGYLKDLLHNKSIRKYISKKLRSFNNETLENNAILKSLDMNIFYKIMTIIIKNKSDDDFDKLYNLFEENIILPDNRKFDKNDLKNFIIVLKFLLELLITNETFNAINTHNINDANSINYISYIKEIYDNINEIQLSNEQIQSELENNNNLIINQKGKGRNRLKIKKIKDIKNKQLDTLNIYNNNLNNTLNGNSINDITSNENIIPNNYNSNYTDSNESLNNSNSDCKTKKKTLKNSKIVTFKIPFTLNNNNTTSNKTSNSIFEINNKKDLNKGMKIDEINKNGLTEKTSFEIYNDENNENIKEKENNRGKKRRKRNTEENKESVYNSKNDENKNDNNDFDYLTNCITFNNFVQTDKKKVNLGKYFLNKLSSGEDIFKLIIEKPKLKKRIDKELSERSNSNEKIIEKVNNDKENNFDNNINTNIENNLENKSTNKGRRK